MRKLSCSVLATIGVLAVSGLTAAPAVALNAQSGMPHEPRTIRGQCAKASHGYHLPYRGWVTRDRLSFNICLRDRS